MKTRGLGFVRAALAAHAAAGCLRGLAAEARGFEDGALRPLGQSLDVLAEELASGTLSIGAVVQRLTEREGVYASLVARFPKQPTMRRTSEAWRITRAALQGLRGGLET